MPYGKVTYVEPQESGNRTGFIRSEPDAKEYVFRCETVRNHPTDQTLVGKRVLFNVRGGDPVSVQVVD